jgi:crotonobetainyl-CoA:carnitine CoA-transferase CaiB-like acyl-CoA transferase
MNTPIPPLPLAALKVIDCASYIAGPAAATVLSDFGAEVIKVEPPEGDPYRTLVPGASYPWDLDARNKRSLALDLKQSEGMAVLHRLLVQADVFITNLPLPARKRLGIDAASLCPSFPRLIYASMTAYGEVGEEAEKTGFDSTAYWARSALSDLVKADHTAEPTRSITGMGDHPSAMSLYAAIMTALYLRERTGQGGVVRTSLMANGLWANSAFAQAQLNGTPPAPRAPRSEAPNPIANIYRCADDRWLNLTILNTRQFPALCEALELQPEIARDERFATPDARAMHHAALIAIFDQRFASRPLSQWRERLDAAGITFSLIGGLADIPGDAQMLATGTLVPFADGNGLTVNSPFELVNHPKKPPARAPETVGRDSRAVLIEAGFTAAEVDTLCSAGTVRQA